MIFQIILSSLSLLLVLSAIELIARKFHLDEIIARKTMHFSAAMFVTISVMLFDYKIYIFIGALFFVLMILSRQITMTSFAKLRQKSLGEIIFPLGIFVAALIAQDTLDFVLAVLILGISDPAAWLIGSQIKSPVLLSNKTLAGSLVFFVTACLILLMVIPEISIVFVALVATLAEALGTRGLDNLTIPLSAVLMLTFLF